MSRESVLAMGRSFAEQGMVDTCLIRRITSEHVDLATGNISQTKATVYSGPCRVQQHQAQSREETVGEAFTLMRMIELQLPISAEGIRPDDEVTITAATNDDDLLNRTWYVRDMHNKTHATARRLTAQERTS